MNCRNRLLCAATKLAFLEHHEQMNTTACTWHIRDQSVEWVTLLTSQLATQSLKPPPHHTVAATLHTFRLHSQLQAKQHTVAVCLQNRDTLESVRKYSITEQKSGTHTHMLYEHAVFPPFSKVHELLADTNVGPYSGAGVVMTSERWRWH